jgi:antitoxin FitA
MPTITVRKLDEETKQALRERAAAHGVSMEEEARRILIESVRGERQRKKPRVEDLLALGVRPRAYFDQKAESDALWAYIEEQ